MRSFPSSRRWPWFNQDNLAEAIAAAGREYRWFQALGGRRHAKLADSPHRAWEHPAFRSYAAYADTPDFAAGRAALDEAARQARTAIMCAEGLWWRCHRRIISDHLTVSGWRVRHILPDGKLTGHEITPFASVIGERIIYDGGQPPLGLK